MKNAIILSLLFFSIQISARVIKVDINGSGQFTTISAALNASVNGDTIKVLPGVYDGALTISKDVVLMGSGYETTIINSNVNPTINMTSGKVQWFAISSNNGSGIWFSGGIVTNCVLRGCSNTGISVKVSASGIISNCIIVENGDIGIWAENENSVSVFNCIGKNNNGYEYGGSNGRLTLNYSRGRSYWSRGNIGNINDNNMQFTASTDYHISPQSGCWDTGKPDVLDPDGSRSDMGYFGGTNCPIYPIVKSVKIIPQPDGSIIIEATGVANY